MAYHNSTDFNERVDDPYYDPDEDYTNYRDNNLYNFYIYLVAISHVVKLILGLTTIVVNILLIIVISNFKRLKCKQNSYIKQYAIFNMLYFIIPPPMCRDIEILAIIIFLLFGTALSFHWLITAIKPQLGIKLKTFSIYIPLLIYVLGVILFLTQYIVGNIYSEHYNAEYETVLITYALLVLFNVVINCMNYKYKNTINVSNTTYALTVSNIIIFSWLPKFVMMLIYLTLVRDYWIIHEIVSMIDVVSEWTSFSTSIIVIVVLMKKNKYFVMAFAKMFKRSVKDYSNDEENLDESEESMSPSERNTNISFNNGTNKITFPSLDNV